VIVLWLGNFDQILGLVTGYAKHKYMTLVE